MHLEKKEETDFLIKKFDLKNKLPHFIGYINKETKILIIWQTKENLKKMLRLSVLLL